MPENRHNIHPGSSPVPPQTARRIASRVISPWIFIVVLCGAILMAMGAGIALLHPALLVSPHDEINNAVRIYAGYLFARNAALAILLIALLLMGARRALGNLVALVGFIQLLDVCVDIAENRWAVAPGVFLFGLVFLLAAARLSDGHPFWKLEAWKS